MGKKYNVILITLDGLRRDYINKMPFLKELTKKGLFFSNMFTVSPYSLGSLFSMFSSLYPSKNGVNGYYNMFRFKKDECKTITQYLQENDYYTVSDTISDCIIPLQGFDKTLFHKNEGNFSERHSKIIMDVAKEAKSKNKPFFIYYQANDLHRHSTQYTAKKYNDFSEEYFKNKKENEKKFYEKTLDCDNYVKTIIETIGKEGLKNNTILIFHSDHGTSIGERIGEKIYGVYVYDYTLKIFSLFLIPGKEPKEITKICTNLDIIPTIMEFIGIKENSDFKKMDGKSLLSLEQEKEERMVFSETGGLFGPWPSPKKHNVFCIRYKNKKIIYNATPKTWEFYDLVKDPKEKNNLINTEIKDIEEYKKMLLKKLEELKIQI